MLPDSKLTKANTVVCLGHKNVKYARISDIITEHDTVYGLTWRTRTIMYMNVSMFLYYSSCVYTLLVNFNDTFCYVNVYF